MAFCLVDILEKGGALIVSVEGCGYASVEGFVFESDKYFDFVTLGGSRRQFK